MAVRHGGPPKRLTKTASTERESASLPLARREQPPGIFDHPYARSVVGYSGTPLVRKLGIKPDDTVWLKSAPPDVDIERLLHPLPPGAQCIRRVSTRPPEIVLSFSKHRREFHTRLAKALNVIDPTGVTWVIWPKKSSELFKAGRQDLTEDVIREHALSLGLVDVKVCAVNETWSGLKLVYRRANR